MDGPARGSDARFDGGEADRSPTEGAGAGRQARDDLGLESRSRVGRWLLLTGDRWHVAAALLATVTLLLAGLLAAGVGDVRNAASLTRLFSSLVGGNLTLITVAITINQLILSREFAAPSELRARVEDSLEYRHAVEDVAADEVSPVTPVAFLSFLARSLRHHAERLEPELADREASPRPAGADDDRAEPHRSDDGTAPPVSDRESAREVVDYARTLIAEADHIESKLDDRPGGFEVLITVLSADFAADLYGAERLRRHHGEALPDSVVETLDGLVDLLEYMGVARRYFETLYLERELAALSRTLLVVGLPAIAASVLATWIYGHPTGAELDRPLLSVVVVGLTGVALAPLVVLVAYVLRITTVTRQSTSLLPFTVTEESPL